MIFPDKSQRTADDIMREVQEITGHSTDGARHLYTVDEDNIGNSTSLLLCNILSLNMMRLICSTLVM